MTDFEIQAAAFADKVAAKLPPGPLKIDISSIMAIVDAIMAIIGGCDTRTKRAYHEGVAKGRVYWTWRARTLVKRYGECDSDMADAVVSAFGELDSSIVEQL